MSVSAEEKQKSVSLFIVYFCTLSRIDVNNPSFDPALHIILVQASEDIESVPAVAFSEYAPLQVLQSALTATVPPAANVAV
jgi:hypothetical protein